jgi:transcriptional regulator with XRE-family HTH domain
MVQVAQMAGLHRATLDRWEKRQVQPRLQELAALLSALDASQEERRHALTLLDAPRAHTLVRLERERRAEEAGLGPMPHGGELLRAMRLRRGWALDDVALHLGVTTATLRRWEKAEAWPSVERLHRLGYILGAREEEIQALLCGRFSQGAPPESGANRPEKAASALVERMEQCARTFYEPPFGLKDLELLALRSQAWTLAAHSEIGVRLLAKVYALTCKFCSYRDRYREAISAAERYFELAPEITADRHGQSEWFIIRLATVTNCMHTLGSASPKRSLDELQRILPLARGARYESGTLLRISEALLLQGAQEEALRLSEEACLAAQRIQGEEEAQGIRGWQGILYIRCGRYAEGLPLLSNGKAGDRYRLVETSLWRAEALLGLDEKTAAQRWLTQAQADLTRYEMTPLQPRLNALQAQLNGEPERENSG